jgi:hypothetical protein
LHEWNEAGITVGFPPSNNRAEHGDNTIRLAARSASALLNVEEVSQLMDTVDGICKAACAFFVIQTIAIFSVYYHNVLCLLRDTLQQLRVARKMRGRFLCGIERASSLNKKKTP